ncbi:hypothetical protein D9619_009574 [Psilocybe cf. subviscida]|uniref:Transmembrane protein n=1 Tax=Psilocybe cf. subviscida TaxID=2480587 RepID=A0A8H5BKQ6_9AGAR|nr:hypothetical protein D9619_009574 [Psilocybe cf. subviscida]
MESLRRRISFAPNLGPLRHNIKFANPAPLKRVTTQAEQDEEDDVKRREALRNLVESWMDRLQLISVITTFFASTEASLITITMPNPGQSGTVVGQLANVGIFGALVVHSNAAIISFLAAFFLVRYKLKIAKDEEAEVERGLVENDPHACTIQSPVSARSSFHVDTEKAERMHPKAKPASPNYDHETDPIPGLVRFTSPTGAQPLFSKNPHLVQTGPNDSDPPTHLLSRCHTLCIFLATLGFVLDLAGMICFAWDRLPLSVSISASFFMALSLFSGLFIVYKPIPPESTMSHRIFVINK